MKVRSGLNTTPASGWFHVVVVYAGGDTAANSKIYINGTEVSSYTNIDGSGAYQSDSGRIAKIGVNGYGNRFTGNLDDLRIYSRVLTQAEITQLHALGTGGGTPTNQPPTAIISATPTSGNTPLTVSFNGSNSSDPNGSITTYTWNFGDGTTATGVSTSHN